MEGQEQADLLYARLMLGNIPEGCLADFGVLTHAVTACAAAEQHARAILCGREAMHGGTRRLIFAICSHDGLGGSQPQTLHITEVVSFDASNTIHDEPCYLQGGSKILKIEALHEKCVKRPLCIQSTLTEQQA